MKASSRSASPWARLPNATPLTGFLLWLYATMPRPLRRVPPALQYFERLRESDQE